MSERIIAIGYKASDGAFVDRLSESQIAYIVGLGLVWQGSAEAGEEFTLDNAKLEGFLEAAPEATNTQLEGYLDTFLWDEIPGVVVTVADEEE